MIIASGTLLYPTSLERAISVPLATNINAVYAARSYVYSSSAALTVVSSCAICDSQRLARLCICLFLIIPYIINWACQKNTEALQYALNVRLHQRKVLEQWLSRKNNLMGSYVFVCAKFKFPFLWMKEPEPNTSPCWVLPLLLGTYSPALTSNLAWV